MNKTHLGSNYDNFLQKDRLLKAATKTAQKRVNTQQKQKETKKEST